MRAMFLEYPNDSYASSKAMQYQYMLGSEMLVAPIYQNTADAENDGKISEITSIFRERKTFGSTTSQASSIRVDEFSTISTLRFGNFRCS